MIENERFGLGSINSGTACHFISCYLLTVLAWPVYPSAFLLCPVPLHIYLCISRNRRIPFPAPASYFLYPVSLFM
jgi:hypothetical protein